jgi:hypothetical protein
VREAEESSLLESVARKRLVKIQQVGKGLTGAVVFVKCGDQRQCWNYL